MSRLGYAASAIALEEHVVAEVTPRAAIVLEGPDAANYLQGQVSQDVFVLDLGECADALLLSPQGKLEAYVRVTRAGAERFVVDLEAGFGEPAYERLRRFKLRVKASLELFTWTLVALRGPRAQDAVGSPAPGTLVLPVQWGRLTGVDLLGPQATLPAGVDEADPDALEVARIRAGWPRMGRELRETTIAASAGIVERTVSFTKGCYTGQELVARLDARGNRVPTRLQRVVAPGLETPPGPGAALERDGRPVGEVTSAALDRTAGETVALAYVRREVETPAAVLLVTPSGEVPAEVAPLPAFP